MAARSCTRRWLTMLMLFLLLVWLPGLIWFYQQIPQENDYPESDVATDAIIVLTGGMGRVEAGLQLLQDGKAKILLISGVDKDVRPQEIVAEYGIDTQNPLLANGQTRIVLDYGPRDTVGNAQETARWMRENGYKSLRLVTSSYHLPRSMMEFRHAMPEMVILPTPVFPEWDALDKVVLVSRGSLRLIFIEYHKYMLRKLYYALPQAWQVIASRTSNLRPLTDIDLGEPDAEDTPTENPTETAP